MHTLLSRTWVGRLGSLVSGSDSSPQKRICVCAGNSEAGPAAGSSLGSPGPTLLPAVPPYRSRRLSEEGAHTTLSTPSPKSS